MTVNNTAMARECLQTHVNLSSAHAFDYIAISEAIVLLLIVCKNQFCRVLPLLKNLIWLHQSKDLPTALLVLAMIML